MVKGRKSILDDEMIHALCKAIASGLTNRSACALSGISESIFYKWLEDGKKDFENGKKSKTARFYSEVKKAESTFIARRLNNIKKQADEGKWQADAWLLERRFPEEFGNKSSVELSGNAQKPVEVEHKGSVGTYAIMLPDNGRD